MRPRRPRHRHWAGRCSHVCLNEVTRRREPRVVPKDVVARMRGWGCALSAGCWPWSCLACRWGQCVAPMRCPRSSWGASGAPAPPRRGRHSVRARSRAGMRRQRPVRRHPNGRPRADFRQREHPRLSAVPRVRPVPPALPAHACRPPKQRVPQAVDGGAAPPCGMRRCACRI